MIQIIDKSIITIIVPKLKFKKSKLFQCLKYINKILNFMYNAKYYKSTFKNLIKKVFNIEMHVTCLAKQMVHY